MGSKLTYRYILTLVLSLVWAVGFAQNDLPKTNEAVRLYQAGDMVAARDMINSATTETLEKEHPFTWYVRGFIYKEFYKKIEKQFEHSENREIAVESIARSIELDAKKMYASDNLKAMEFLSISYYNDAVVATKSLSYDNVDEPEFFYSKYKSTLMLVKPDFDFTQKDLEFYKNLAKGYGSIYVLDVEQNGLYINKSIELYDQALEINPEDYEALYNCAISYYNQGVFKIRKVNHNTDIFELIIIQDQCVELFKASLPYMEKAHEMAPKRKETLKGLMAIYYSLNDYEKSKEYKETILRLIDAGEIEE